MKYYVVKTNNSSNALYVRELNQDNNFKYICVVDQLLVQDQVLLETKHLSYAEEYVESHWL